MRYTDDICDIKRGTQIENKPKQNANQIQPNPQEKELPTDNEVDFDNLSNVMDEEEQNKMIDEILEENEDEVENKNIPSDVDEPTHSDTETAHSDTNGEVVGPDNEDDGLAPTTENEEKLNEELDEQENGHEETSDIESKDEIERETNDEVDNNIPNERSINEEDGEENIENEVDTSVAPTSDFVNEEDAVNKSEEDNVVDGIVGDGDLSDSTNER